MTTLIINELINLSSLVLEIWCVSHTESISSQGLSTLWALSGHMAMVIVVDGAGLEPRLGFWLRSLRDLWPSADRVPWTLSSPAFLLGWRSVSSHSLLSQGQIHRVSGHPEFISQRICSSYKLTDQRNWSPSHGGDKKVSKDPWPTDFLPTDNSPYPSNGSMEAKNWKHFVFTVGLPWWLRW